MSQLPPNITTPTPTWFPHENGLVFTRNPNRLQSAFIGLTFPLINLPMIIWHMLIKPGLISVWMICAMIIAIVANGLCGNLVGLRLPPGVVAFVRRQTDENG